MKQLCKENILLYAVKGQEGVGRTSFARKAASYLVQRKIYDEYFEVDFYGIRDLDMFGSIFS